MFDLILGSDTMYERLGAELLAKMLARLCAPPAPGSPAQVSEEVQVRDGASVIRLFTISSVSYAICVRICTQNMCAYLHTVETGASALEGQRVSQPVYSIAALYGHWKDVDSLGLGLRV